MKLVLDEHFSQAPAEQLRERGYDVIAVVERTELRQFSDPALLAWAQREERVLVTENVRDFMPIHHTWLSRGETHPGLFFTSPRAFPRRTAATGLLVSALAASMEQYEDVMSLEGGIAWL